MFAVVALGFVMLSALAVVPPLYAVYRPKVDSLPQSADAIVVFAGETRRTELALQLAEAGRSDILVVSFGMHEPVASSRCEETEPFAVTCPEALASGTRGEARMFAELAEQNGWGSIIAVTGDYHSARARTWADRCIDAEVSFALVEWGAIGRGVARHELGGLLAARFLQRSC